MEGIVMWEINYNPHKELLFKCRSSYEMIYAIKIISIEGDIRSYSEIKNESFSFYRLYLNYSGKVAYIKPINPIIIAEDFFKLLNNGSLNLPPKEHYSDCKAGFEVFKIKEGGEIAIGLRTAWI